MSNLTHTATAPAPRAPRNKGGLFVRGRRWLKVSPAINFVATLGEVGGKLAIFIALASWLYEAPDRAKQKHYQAWQVVNSAFGKPGNGGRSEALKDLLDDDVDNQSVFKTSEHHTLKTSI